MFSLCCYFNSNILHSNYLTKLHRFQLLSEFDATLQNFIHKHTVGLEDVQRNKKKGKREFTGRPS
jgi:hypothetical protein